MNIFVCVCVCVFSPLSSHFYRTGVPLAWQLCAENGLFMSPCNSSEMFRIFHRKYDFSPEVQDISPEVHDN